jgi:hypothetical protein
MRLVRNLVLQILKERFYNVQLSIFVHCHPRTQSSQRLESQQLFLFVRCHPRKLGSQRLESQAPAPVCVPKCRALLSKRPADSRQICTRRVWLKKTRLCCFCSQPMVLDTSNLCPFCCSGTRKRSGIPLSPIDTIVSNFSAPLYQVKWENKWSCGFVP